jgi:acyl carrier protein
VAESCDRLIRCFSSVFPTLAETEIRKVDVAMLMSTDSLTGVTLAALIGEEFGVETDVEDLLGLGTFGAIEEFLRKKSPSSPTPSEGTAE